jgi:NAD(P)-dependent dehydrogenase (short-subunit alcohol dehydrogenase family)
MNLGLAAKVALVTGAGRDIGREIALVLGREGAAVAVNYATSKEAAEATASEIRSAGSPAIAVGADVTDYAAVGRMVQRIRGEWGPIDVLVNNAGMVRRKFFLETTPEEWRAQIDVGMYGMLNCCHAIARPWSSARAAASSTSPATPRASARRTSASRRRAGGS